MDTRKLSDEHKRLLIHAIERDIRTHDDMVGHYTKHLKFQRIEAEKRQAALLREVLSLIKGE